MVNQQSQLEFGTTACFAFSLYGPNFSGSQVIESIHAAAKLGYDNVELEAITDEQVSIFQGDSLELVRRTLDEYGMRVPVFAPFFAATALVSPDAQTRKRGLEQFAVSVEIAAALGCDHLQLASAMPDELIGVVHPEYPNAPPSATNLGGMTWARLWSDHVETMAEATRLAGASGVRLSIEPRVNCMVGNVDAFLRLADAVGSTNLGVSLDPVHALRTGDAPELAIAKCGELLYKFEFADALDSGVDHVVPGTGVLNWAAIWEALAAVKYSGAYDVDIITKSELALESYESGLAFVRALADSGAPR